MRLQCHYLKTFFSGGIDQDFTKSPQGKKKPFVQARMTHEFNFFVFIGYTDYVSLSAK